MRKSRNVILVAAALSALTGCTSLSYVVPAEGTIIPDGRVNIAPHTSYSFEQIAAKIMLGMAINVVYQPFAPNWQLEEAVLDERTYYVRMQAKRFRIGGDGEAMMIMKRRAQQLTYERGYTSYRILDFAEGVESSTPIAQRFSEGIIQLVKADSPPAASPR